MHCQAPLYNNISIAGVVLPESMGALSMSGDLTLFNCGLTSLPDSFGDIVVGGFLSRPPLSP